MFESNFPVDKGLVSYRTLWNTFKKVANKMGLSAAEKDMLFKGTAMEVYGVKQDKLITKLSLKDKIKTVFRTWDTAQTGYISQRQLKAVMSQLAPDMTEEDHEVLFKAIDEKGNGNIDYELFIDWAICSVENHLPSG